MILGGNATIFVSDMDGAVLFYTETLASKDGPPAGRSGSISVGFSVTQPLEEVVATLQKRGVRFLAGIVQEPPTTSLVSHSLPSNLTSSVPSTGAGKKI